MLFGWDIIDEMFRLYFPWTLFVLPNFLKVLLFGDNVVMLLLQLLDCTVMCWISEGRKVRCVCWWVSFCHCGSWGDRRIG